MTSVETIDREDRKALSLREEAVLALTIAGLCDKEIASRLGIGVESVRTYWGRIKSKLKVEGRAEAVLEASNRDFAGVLRAQEVENRELLQEIHRRHIAESLLAESEARFRFFCETSRKGVFMADRLGKCTFTNLRCNQILGVTDSEMHGYGWLRLPWSPKMRRKLREGVRELNSKDIHRAEYDYVKDVKRHEVLISVCAVKHNEGIAGYFGIVEDLTERGVLESKLMEALRFGKCVSAATDDIVYLHDLPSARTIYVNHASERLFGMTCEEIRAAGDGALARFIDPRDHTKLAEAHALYAPLKDGEAVRLDFRAIAADGTRPTLSGRVVVYKRDDFGQPSIMLGVLRIIPEE